MDLCSKAYEDCNAIKNLTDINEIFYITNRAINKQNLQTNTTFLAINEYFVKQ